MSSWLEPFYICGEVNLIRLRTGDWSQEPHKAQASVLLRQMTVRVARPDGEILTTVASVGDFLKSNVHEHGMRVVKYFQRKFVFGWEWRYDEGDKDGIGAHWYRFGDDYVLRTYEWNDLKAILRQYDGVKRETAAKRSEAGKKGMAKRWEKSAL